MAADAKTKKAITLGRKAGAMGGGTGEFYMPAQDTRGHSARVDFRVIPALKRNINMVVDRFGPVTGWETDSDFLRWAVYLGLETISTRCEDTEMNNRNKQIRAMADIMSLEDDMLIFNQTMSNAEKYVREMEAIGAREQARMMLRNIYGQIRRMEDSQWRRTWDKEFKIRFAHYIKAAGLKPEDWVKDGDEDRD